MCYRPISIRIKPRNFNPVGGQLMTSNVSCGHCPACQMTKKDEWSFRMFYEIDDCLNKGGIVVSQALTYSNDNVPWLSDFIPVKYGEADVMCFNRSHITKFLKLLRVHLERKGYAVANNIRYFISSEYGSDPTKTRRPHYHGIFLSTAVSTVNGQSLDWSVLSSTIEECWPHGRSDGFKTISREREDWYNYFFNPLKPHVLTSTDKMDFVKFSKISDYVAKYVVKDIEYEDTIVSRCSKYLDSVYEHDSVNYKDLMRELKRDVKEFHVQSLGFGSSMLMYNNIADIIKYGTIKKPSSDPNKGLWVTLPIPLYYARKLFMQLRKRQDNSLYWCYTSKGKEFFKARMIRKLESLELKLYTLLQSNEKLAEKIRPLLGNRSLRDLCVYLCLYRGRSKPYYPVTTDVVPADIMLDDICSVYDDLRNTYEIDFKDGQYYAIDAEGNYKDIYYFLNSDTSVYSEKDEPFAYFDEIYLHFAAEIAVISQMKDKQDSQKLLFPNLFKNNYK